MKTLQIALFIIPFLIFSSTALAGECPTSGDYQPCDGNVTMDELTDYIDAWYMCSACVPDLFQAMQAYYGVPFCGDGSCNGDENCSSCPEDCGCGSGYVCQDGVCIRPGEPFPQDYVSYWKFDTKIGGVTPDETGVNNGTIIGGENVTFPLVENGSVIDFGQGGAVFVNATDNGMNPDEGTISVWFKRKGYNSGYPNYIFSMFNWSGWSWPAYVVNRMYIVFDGDSDILRVAMGSRNQYDSHLFVDIREVELNEWHLTTFTWEGAYPGANYGTYKFYFDAQLNLTHDYHNFTLPKQIKWGSWIDLPGIDNPAYSDEITEEYFKGQLDNALIYDRILSEIEIQQIYNILKPVDLSCTNDYGCSEEGSFCDGNMPYDCTLGADGCLDRINGSECGTGEVCQDGSCVGAPPSGNVYYVDNSASGCSDGSTNYDPSSKSCGTGSDTVYLSLTSVAPVPQAGDTVLVRAGTYYETLTPVNSGTAGSLITFKAYPDEACQGGYGETKTNCQVVIDGTGLNAHGVHLADKTYIRIEGFEIRNSGLVGIMGFYEGAYDTGGGNWEIVNNYIHHTAGGSHWAGDPKVGDPGTDGSGFATLNSDNILIENNEFYHIADYGILMWGLVGCSNVTVRGNNIHYISLDGLMVGTGFAPDAVFENYIVEDNVLYDSFDTGTHQDAINFYSGKNITIRNNIVYDFTQLIYFPLKDVERSSLEDVEIYGNILYNDRCYIEYGQFLPQGEAYVKGIFIDARRSDNVVRDINIHSNTIGWVTFANWGVIIVGATDTVIDGITLRNNIFYETGSVIDNAATNVDSDYNLYYNAGTDVTSFEGSHSLINTADPQFVNHTRHEAWDFHLQPTSPAIDNGTDLSLIFDLPSPFLDLDGISRPQGLVYDIGAYEYVEEAAQTCAEQNGFICSDTEYCPSNEIIASDTDRCCDVDCEIGNWNLCSECGTGLFNICDRFECQNITENCYFIDELIGGSCDPCLGAVCTDYNGDQQSCEADRCGLGSCSWDGSNCV